MRFFGVAAGCMLGAMGECSVEDLSNESFCSVDVGECQSKDSNGQIFSGV